MLLTPRSAYPSSHHQKTPNDVSTTRITKVASAARQAIVNVRLPEATFTAIVFRSGLSAPAALSNLAERRSCLYGRRTWRRTGYCSALRLVVGRLCAHVPNVGKNPQATRAACLSWFHRASARARYHKLMTSSHRRCRGRPRSHASIRGTRPSFYHVGWSFPACLGLRVFGQGRGLTATPSRSGSAAMAALSSLGARRSCSHGCRTWRRPRGCGSTEIQFRPDS